MESSLPRITMDDLLRRHGVASVDLIKLDIEGSEFALFDSAEWLQRVTAISMEVHPRYGDPNVILERMKQNGFAYVVADENLHRIRDAKQASFIYAWKNA